MRLGLLTSGGDCAGLNAVIRAVVKRAVLGYGWQVFGIRQATHGLLARPVDAIELTADSVAGILPLGGTLLGTTNRGDPFNYPAAGEAESALKKVLTRLARRESPTGLLALAPYVGRPSARLRGEIYTASDRAGLASASAPEPER